MNKKEATRHCWDAAVCPVCGKEFFPTKEWVYRLNFEQGRLKYKPVCSYGCLCRAEKDFESRAEAKKASGTKRKGGMPKGSKMKKPGNARGVRCMNTGIEYGSARSASLDTGVSAACIGEICRGHVKLHRKTGLSFEFIE